jgi:hypothetical protein
MRRPATSAIRIFCFLWSAVSLFGCRAEPAIDDTAGAAGQGRVGLALQVAPGVTVSSATYTITGPGGFSTTGTVGVGQTSNVLVNVSQIASPIMGGLPPGTGYVIDVTATASDADTICAGSAPFDVTAGEMTPEVIVHLVCRQWAGAEDRAGHRRVGGQHLPRCG